MKYCSYCGKALHPEARFCESCGKTVVPETASVDEEKKCLDTFYRFLKYERLAWKISGIVLLILGCIFLLMGLVFLAAVFGVPEDATIVLAVFTAYMFVFAVVFLPVAIVNLVVSRKVRGYMHKIYTDPAAALERCGCVGTIVLAAFFNNIALIFVIINFVRTKTNRVLLEQIIARRR